MKPIDDVQKITIFFPHGELPDKLRVGIHSYPFKDVVQIVEDIADDKFVCRYTNRAIKNVINTSIEVKLLPVKEGIIIFGKKGTSYLLRG